jgi:hypothetical protein
MTKDRFVNIMIGTPLQVGMRYVAR